MIDADRPALRERFVSSRKAAFHWLPPDSFRSGDFDAPTRDFANPPDRQSGARRRSSRAIYRYASIAALISATSSAMP
jgi:hypothetical protein